MSLKLLFAVSFRDLFFTIQYAVFRKSLSTFYVSLYVYMCVCMCVYICIYIVEYAKCIFDMV